MILFPSLDCIDYTLLWKNVLEYGRRISQMLSIWVGERENLAGIYKHRKLKGDHSSATQGAVSLALFFFNLKQNRTAN